MEVQIASVVRKEILGEIKDEGTMTQAQASVRDLERAAAAIRRGGPKSQLDKAVLAQITGIKRAVAALQMSRNRGAVPSVGGGLPYPRSVFLARVDPGVRGAIIATPTMSIVRHSN